MQWLADVDAKLFLLLNRLHNYLRLERLLKAISFTGDGHCYVLLALLLPALYSELDSLFPWVILLGFAIELPVYWVLKNSFKRRRPFIVVKALAPLLTPSDEFSFPSGHTAAAFMMACLVSVFVPQLTVFMYVWACLIGLSRVMLRVHFISDVLAGVALGTTAAFLSLALIA